LIGVGSCTRRLSTINQKLSTNLLSTLVSQLKNRSAEFRGTELKDQTMKKVRSLALAGCFAIVAAHCGAQTISENFSSDPLQNGWQAFGNASLFQWNPTNQNLDVTWDSSNPNSYFYHPLGTTLTKADAFAVDFDIRLNDLQWTNTFQIAAGFLNFSNATDPGFSRPLGYTPNIFEFNYFPDDGFSEPNIAASMTDQTASLTNFPDFYFIFDTLPMGIGATYHVRLTHPAGAALIEGEVFTNGQLYTAMPLDFAGAIHDFQLDIFSISSYSDAGQDPLYYGSIRAQGIVDNIVVTLPPAVRNMAGTLTNGVWQVQCGTYAGQLYTLQRTVDLQTWTDVSSPAAGTGSKLFLQDTNPPANNAFYRVKAEQP
jgi:hypothetical protein